MTRKSVIALILLVVVTLAVVTLAIPAVSQAQVAVGVSIRIGPPPLPVYAQPICPGPRYIWAPGYWAYGPDGYYWVPGTWVFAPEPGLLWTPGYWAFDDGFYVWHRGYWGPHVGFYGGINYGYGYPGVGFYGGEWRRGEFFYNRSVTNINVTVVHNVYERRVVVRNDSRFSFNGDGGVRARPNRDEERWEHERHWDPTPDQDRHRAEASHNRDQWQSVNHGRPAFAATQRPGEFDRRDMNRRDGDNRFNDNGRGNDRRDLQNGHRDNGRDNRDNRMDRSNRGQGNRPNRDMDNRRGGQGNRGDRGDKGRPGKPGKPDRDQGRPHGPGGRGL